MTVGILKYGENPCFTLHDLMRTYTKLSMYKLKVCVESLAKVGLLDFKEVISGRSDEYYIWMTTKSINLCKHERLPNIKATASAINKVPKECFWNKARNFVPIRAVYVASKHDVGQQTVPNYIDEFNNSNAMSDYDMLEYLGINSA